MHQDSRHIYYRLLRKQLYPEDFYPRIAVLLENDQYFFPGHLEMLWYAEKRNDQILYKEILNHTYTVIKTLLASAALQNQMCERWGALERNALFETIDELLQRPRIKYEKKLLLWAARAVFSSTIHLKTIEGKQEYKHLKCVATIDPQPLQKEMRDCQPYWWQLKTERQDYLSQHQHTHSISIRERTSNSSEYNPVDGVHESMPVPHASRFIRVHAAVLQLASELNIGLGRVVITRLKPHKQAYRHYDSEDWLFGRKRYHLVIKAGLQNILSAADETVVARPGEVWFFDNKVMHRAHNKSPYERIHVIFDGYPLG